MLPLYAITLPESLRPTVLALAINARTNVARGYATALQALTGLRDVSDQPGVLVVYVPNTLDLGNLRQLRTHFPAWPILALVEAESDPGLLIAAMRNGAAQVVAVPIQAADFAAALACILEPFVPPPPPSQVIAVSGATGGAGATTIALNLAFELTQQTTRTLILAEPSVQFGRLATFLDIQPSYTSADVLSQTTTITPESVRSALHAVEPRFTVLVAEYRALPPQPPKPEAVQQLVTCLRSLAEVIILDLPCTYDDLFFGLLSGAQQVVLVADQKIPAIRTLQMVFETLGRTEGERQTHIVINRYDPKLPGFSADRLRQLLEVPSLHTIASDFKAVSAAINAGRSLRAEAPRSPTLTDLMALARRMADPIGGTVTPTRTKSALLGRLVRAFGLSQ
jgi:pilus assembly protein CpaE